MARNKLIEDPLADIAISIPEGAGFAPVPQPEMDANALARAIAHNEPPVGPVAMPEEAQAPPRPIEAMQVRARKPIAEIVDEFLAAIHAHQDAKILTSTISGLADETEAQAFPDSPARSLRVDHLRIIRRTSTEVVPAPSAVTERRRWQDAVIAGHIEEMRPQQEARAQSWKREGQTPKLDPTTIAAIAVAVAQVLKSQQEPAKASA